MKTYKLVAGLTAAAVLMPSVALAAPFDLKIVHRDGADAFDVNQSLTPPTLLNGSNYFPYFDDTSETYKFSGIGSGFNLAGGYWSVTPYSIETTDGHLSDTLGILQSEINSINSPPTQIQPDWTSTSSPAAILHKPTLSPSYEGTTTRANSFPIFKSATVASGVAAVNLTSDGTSGGTAICTGGVIKDSVSVIFNDAASSFQQSWAFSNSDKTLTVTANKFTSANILSGLLGQAAANGSVAKVSVWCYA